MRLDGPRSPSYSDRCLWVRIFSLVNSKMAADLDLPYPFSQRDYYRRYQDEVLSTPIEIVRRLPANILQLLGYSKWLLLDHRSVLLY